MSGGMPSARRMMVTISPMVADASSASITRGTRFFRAGNRCRHAIERSAQWGGVSLALELFDLAGVTVPGFDLRGSDVPQEPVVLFGEGMHVDADQRHVAFLHRALGGFHGLVEDVAEEALRRQGFR